MKKYLLTALFFVLLFSCKKEYKYAIVYYTDEGRTSSYFPIEKTIEASNVDEAYSLANAMFVSEFYRKQMNQNMFTKELPAFMLWSNAPLEDSINTSNIVKRLEDKSQSENFNERYYYFKYLKFKEFRKENFGY